MSVQAKDRRVPTIRSDFEDVYERESENEIEKKYEQEKRKVQPESSRPRQKPDLHTSPGRNDQRCLGLSVGPGKAQTMVANVGSETKILLPVIPPRKPV